MDFDVKFDASHSQHSSVPSNSSENFQKFMYDLFEKNGILNNLRAHLRSHIINVLKSATTGNQPISTPINFKKHLEPNHQALNILLAEYLLKMELNYSLSVFVSEIPLANMPFGFAKLLMQRPEEEMQAQKLKEDDIISVLNCLGIQSDSDLICQVIGQYKNTDKSLLQCILQSLTISQKKLRNIDDYYASNLMSHSSSSIKSSDFEKNKQNCQSQSPTCNHIRKCAVCEGKVFKLKEKYADKIRQYKKMFQEVRSVYEGELQMLRSSEERRIHASVASHAIALKKRITQLEDQYHLKEAQLQIDVRDKKQLLRNLMNSIQQEHLLLTNTIRDINLEANKLAEKEEQMKKQIQDAEKFIKQRSQDMTNQIQCELEILVSHLRSLKEEKQNIAKEKTELENLKKYCERNQLPDIRVNDHCNDPDHILVTNQLKKLKNVLDTLGVNKNLIERSTITELKDVTSKLNVILNNEQELTDERPTSCKITPNKLFNQFRKNKNINFSSDPEEARRDVCTSSSHRNIREENDNLRTIAAQQSARIQELTNEVVRAQASLATPNTLRATVFQPFNVQLQRLSAMPGCSNPNGGGEELNAFRGRPVSAPAVSVPFINAHQDAHCSRQRASRHTSKPSKSRRGQTHDKVLQEARRTLRKLEIEAEAVHNSYVEFKKKRDTRLDSGSRENLAGPTKPLNTNKNSAPREVIVMAGTTQLSRNEKLFNNLTETVRHVNPIPADYGALRPPRERTRNHVDTPLTEFRKLYSCTEKNKSQEKSLEQFNRGVFINDEKVLSTTNLDVPDEPKVTPKLEETKKTYAKPKVTDVYTCGIINDFQNKCAEICLDIPMRDNARSESDKQTCMLKVEIENITNYALLDSSSKKPFLLEIQNSVDTNEVEIVTIKPSDTELQQGPNTSAVLFSPINDTEKQISNANSPTNTASKTSDFGIINFNKINDKIEKLKMENDDYQNDGFEESSSDENMSSKSEQEAEKPRLVTINEEDKSDKMFELLSNTTNDLEIYGEEDEYPDDFTDLVASGDSPKSIAKQYTESDTENFWQP